jgi:hypothetical protein
MTKLTPLSLSVAPSAVLDFDLPPYDPEKQYAGGHTTGPMLATSRNSTQTFDNQGKPKDPDTDPD